MKRSLLSLLMVFTMALLLTGCGTEKPKDTADAAIKAYAEIYTFADKSNAPKTGQTAADIDKLIQGTEQGLKQMFAPYEITDAQQAELAKKYLATMKSNSNIQTKIKTVSDTEPVVELSMKRIDGAKFAQMMQNDEGLVEIGAAKGLIQSGQGGDATMTDYQQAVTQRLGLLLENMPFKTTVDTVDVPCIIAKGEGDKTFWTPKDINVITNFIGGK